MAFEAGSRHYSIGGIGKPEIALRNRVRAVSEGERLKEKANRAAAKLEREGDFEAARSADKLRRSIEDIEEGRTKPWREVLDEVESAQTSQDEVGE